MKKKMGSSYRMCLDSVVLENGFIVGEGSKQSSSSEVKPVLSPATKMVRNSDNKDKDKDKDKDVVDGSFGRKNKLGRRSFSRYVKAVFFETSLVKKMRNKKLGQKLHRIYNGDKFKSKSKPKKIFDSMNNNNAPFEDNHSTSSTSKFPSCLCTNLATNSLSSSSSSSSSPTTSSSCSSSSSVSWKSRPSLSDSAENNMQGKVGKSNGKGCHGSNVCICCLLLLSLSVLVIWGKVCAIFCTSTWLFFFANRRNITSTKCDLSNNITANDQHFPEIDSKLYKKKVIMEGLLERNHSRNLPFALLKQY